MGAAFPSSVTPGAEGNTGLDVTIGRLLKNLLPCADDLVNENKNVSLNEITKSSGIAENSNF